jgi:hypothetical protein
MPARDQTEKELENIRRLIILLLVKLGTTSEEIGLALGVDSSAIRKMMPVSKFKVKKERN